MQQKTYSLKAGIVVKQTSLSIAVAAVMLVASGAAGFAAERPSYQTTGLPISAVQLAVLGVADVQQQAPVSTSTLTPLQLSVLTPRTKTRTATVAPGGSAGLSTH
jgi:hypothetical protein